MLKVIVSIFLLFVFLILIGVSGALFYIWPTGFPDKELDLTAEINIELSNLLDEPKFKENMKYFYPGAINEASRVIMEEQLNILLNNLIIGLQKNPRKSFVLNNFKATLRQVSEYDSEDRDMFLIYLEQIMGILNIKSSNELFNVWRYGLPIGWVYKNV